MNKLKILIAEDHLLILDLAKECIQYAFSEHGIDTEIICVPDGQDVIDLYSKGYSFDVFFTDMIMKNINGDKAINYVRQKDNKVLIVIVSAYQSMNTINTIISEKKATKCFYKPVDYDIIVNFVCEELKLT